MAITGNPLKFQSPGPEIVAFCFISFASRTHGPIRLWSRSDTGLSSSVRLSTYLTLLLIDRQRAWLDEDNRHPALLRTQMSFCFCRSWCTCDADMSSTRLSSAGVSCESWSSMVAEDRSTSLGTCWLLSSDRSCFKTRMTLAAVPWPTRKPGTLLLMETIRKMARQSRYTMWVEGCHRHCPRRSSSGRQKPSRFWHQS